MQTESFWHLPLFLVRFKQPKIFTFPAIRYLQEMPWSSTTVLVLVMPTKEALIPSD